MATDTEINVQQADLRVKRFRQISEGLADLFEDKNDDYGDSAFLTYEEWGMESFAIRLEDKLNRVKSLVRKQEEGEEINVDESLEDTLNDLAAYAIMAVIAMKEEQGKGVKTGTL